MCPDEFPECNKDETKTMKSNFFLNLAFMNHSQPIGWIKSFPIITILFGFSYLLNSRLLLYFKMETVWMVLFGTILAIFFLIYLFYQILCLHPKPHEPAIGCCITRRLWNGEENFMIIIALLLTLIVTPIFIISFYTFAGVVPFLLVLFESLGLNDKLGTSKLKIFDNNDSTIPKYIFVATMIISLLLAIAEITSCFNDYYKNDMLKISNSVLNMFTYSAGILGPFILVAVSMYSNSQNYLPQATNSSTCGSGKCSVHDPEKADTALTEKIKNLVAPGGALVEETTDAFDATKSKRHKETLNVLSNGMNLMAQTIRNVSNNPKSK